MTLAFLADEHVPRVLVSTLRSHGYTVTTAQERYGQDTDDDVMLADCADDGLVLLTNDRDFVELADSVEHAGVLLYTSTNPSPAALVQAVERLEQFVGPEELAGRLVWIEDWT